MDVGLGAAGAGEEGVDASVAELGPAFTRVVWEEVGYPTSSFAGVELVLELPP